MLEFLLSNPFVAVILLVLLSSAFKKFVTSNEDVLKKVNDSKKQQTTSIQETYGDKKTDQAQLQMDNRSSDFLQEQLMLLREKTNRTTSAVPQKGVKSSEIATKPKVEQLNIDQRKMVDAIIWSEILGPAKSRQTPRNKRVSR